MKALSDKEREFVAIGAALASNCIPCVIYHIGESKKTGITEGQLREAIELAVSIRRVPAQQVVDTAYAQLGDGSSVSSDQVDGECSDCC